MARRYGFASWARLRRHVDAISSRTWVAPDAPDRDRPADTLVRLACLTYDHDDSPDRNSAAAAWLDAHGDLAADGPAAAAVCADAARLREFVSADVTAAVAPGGPYGWTPLFYLAYSRLEVPGPQAVAAARVLLDAGADPNDGRFFGGCPTPFTVLTGVFGGGERDQPPHRHAAELARILLAAGADPNDRQALYNRMFRTQDDFLEILFEFGLGRGDGGPWRRLLPDVTPDPATSVRELLRWAVVHDQRDRVTLLARHGVDLDEPIAGGPRPVELALRNGHRELADHLIALGARPVGLRPLAAFVAAALSGDADTVRSATPKLRAAARRRRPGLVVWAAAQERIDAVDLLVEAGFDVNALARSDVPVEQPWQTALHTAVERGNEALVRRLLELGADTTIRDARFDGTPADWARHFDRDELLTVLDGSR